MVEGSALPSGVVTFLFTDIEGSTRLIRLLGEPAYQVLLERHQGALRRAWQEHRGHEVNTEGDAFFVAFANADDAVAAAVRAQQLLVEVDWGDGPAPVVRMGIHTGFARPHNDDYAALAVNQAARVVSAAHGGQILLSDDAVEALQDAPDDLLEPVGRFAVRDFDGPQQVHRVRPQGWTASDRPPGLRPADGHNIVAPTNELIGRVDDVDAIRSGLESGGLLTIAGPGGIGKTRLATHVGLTVADEWQDGVWVVDLASATTVDRVAWAIVEALGAPTTPGRPALDDVLAHLAERRCLLVLDNCEQALEAVAAVTGQVLRACRDIAVLATSRAPIGLRGERVHRLQPLPTDAVTSPAVELFLARTSGSRDDHEVVRELCELVEGLPLAIELVAARSAAIGPATALEWLREHPLALELRDPTLPERHRSLERVLDWSRHLLGPREQVLLRRIGVFAGSFDLATAAAVAAPDLTAVEASQAMWTLVDHSLVIPEPGIAGRLRLFGAVRVYASAMTPPQERVAAVRAAADHVLARLGPARVNDRDWPGAFALELPNVRGIIDELVRVDEEVAHTLAWCVAHHGRVTGALATGVEEAARHLDQLHVEGPARVALLTILASLQFELGEVARARGVLDRAATMAERVGTAAWDEQALRRMRGEVAIREGDLAQAERLGREALQDAETASSRGRSWNLIGVALASAGRTRDALEAFVQELRCAQEADADFLLSRAYGNVAEMQQRLGAAAAAARHQLASLDLARANGERIMIGYAMLVAARLAAEHGDPVGAAELHEAARQVLDAAGLILYESDAEVDLAFEERLRDELGAAELDAARARGAALGQQEAADRAAETLRDVAGIDDATPEPEGNGNGRTRRSAPSRR